MLKNLTFLLIFFCFLTMSCRDETLEGHWHVYHNQKNKEVFHTLDFNEKGKGYFNQYALRRKSDITYNTEKKKIFINDMGVYGIFNYNLKNDSLFLENEQGFKWIGKRYSNLSKEHFIKDHFSYTDLTIDLVKVDTLTIKTFPFEKYYSQIISIGKPQPIGKECFYRNWMVQIEDNYVTTADLQLWNENLLASKPETLRHLIVYTIFIHKEISLKNILPVIEELKRIGVKNEKILIVSLTPNPINPENPFRLFHYKNINFDNLERTLQESI